MVDEVLEYLRPSSGTVVDATVGGGGHAKAILAHAGVGSGLFLVGLDRDREAIVWAEQELVGYDNKLLLQASYERMAEIVLSRNLHAVTGVLFDLGVSLHQLVSCHRGFGFQVDGPLDMRFDVSAGGPTARELIRQKSARDLRELLRTYGEEPMSGRIARVIFERRHSIETTADLAAAIRAAVPARFRHKALMRVFQALRIAVNAELVAVRTGLQSAIKLLGRGGRLVVISYHSLEDRIAKECLRQASTAGVLRILTPKPVRPNSRELVDNPRCRSARLRAAEKVIDSSGFSSFAP